jgi:hypothetical protein
VDDFSTTHIAESGSTVLFATYAPQWKVEESEYLLKNLLKNMTDLFV